MNQVLCEKIRDIALMDESSFLTADEVRTFIALDVLELLEKDRLLPKSGTWFQIANDSDDYFIFSKDDVEKKRNLSEIISRNKICSVCAIGAIFKSALDMFPKVTCDQVSCAAYSDILGFGEMRSFLLNYFELDQLMLIETAFEGGNHTAFGRVVAPKFHEKNADAVRNAINMHNRYPDVKERMTVIMQNIVDNEGQFVPAGD